MTRIRCTIGARDARVLRALHTNGEDIPLEDIAERLGITFTELRQSMSRLALREPVRNEMRLVKGESG